ncbi:hypothetical protein ACFFT4_02325, partial [Cohnella cellulosilytica]|uniref:hypothetical protein n=1 Tax=Cohnella cellulosilytica TaxID=986710 RepID=UPI0035EE68C2
PDEGKPHVRFDEGGAGKVNGGLAPSNEIPVLYSTGKYKICYPRLAEIKETAKKLDLTLLLGETLS